MIELLAHLEARNAKTLAWINEDPDNRWASLYEIDADFWIERGITTLEQFEREELELFIWDAHKDAHGFRPRYINFKEMTMDELRAYANRMSQSLADEIEREKEMQKIAFDQFVARIEEIQAQVVGSSKEDAIRIIADAEGITKEEFEFYGNEILENEFGLEYGTISKMVSE